MPTSVMPKGVEHSPSICRAAAVPLMPTSVMPKGVEHCADRDDCVWKRGMPTSVMPKGVEHHPSTVGNNQKIADAHLCDAERR